MRLLPNCKINIGLHVVRKRADGYHDLETIFYPVYGLHDVLDIEVEDGGQDIELTTGNIQIDCSSDDNLVVRCYRQMRARHPQVGSVRVHLTKNIPFGAGLGGGSSDAAHTAVALNELFRLGLNKKQLAEEVRSLGADCPFFIHNRAAFATGIGDILTPIDLDLSGWNLVIVKPEIHVSTRDAYAGVTPQEPLIQLKYIARRPVSEWQSLMHNDFEHSVFQAHPELAAIKDRLLDLGATYAAMSGSGSALYGLFTSPILHIEEKFPNCFVRQRGL